MRKQSMLKIYYIASFILLGAVIMVLTMIYFSRKFDDESEKQFVLIYTKDKQLEFGSECSQLKFSLKKFLEMKINPVIAKRKANEPWFFLVTKELSALKHHDHYLRMCAALYRHGKNGQLNGLENLYYTDDAITEYSNILNLLESSVNPPKDCDENCSETRFRIIDESAIRLMLILNGQSPQHESSLTKMPRPPKK